jgi:nucleoside-diphosphate-sugar epimerase
MNETHLVTGGTGFVGGALILELMSETDAQVLCLVRSKDGFDAAQARLQSSLATAARSYHRTDLLGEIERRCRAIPGDILEPLCCNETVVRGTVSEVWHCAASLQFEDENDAEIFAHNVHGTKNVLDLATRSRAPKFNYVSTAYVAGSRTGPILEELPLPETQTNNSYERSKIFAELIVANKGHMHTRIFRPSIVIGHSRTLMATSFTGLYGFIRELCRFKRKVARRLGGYLAHRHLCIWADEQVPINLIPVDMVASSVVRISRSNSARRIFHLTNDRPVAVEEILKILFHEVDMRAPRYVKSSAEFTSIDEVFDHAIRFYRSYLSNAKVFDRTNSESVLGASALSSNLRGENLLRHIRWYMAHLADTRCAALTDVQGADFDPEPVRKRFESLPVLTLASADDASRHYSLTHGA